VHGDLNDSCKNGKDSVVSLLTFLVLDILVPEGVGKEIEAYGGSAPFKEPINRANVSLAKVREPHSGSGEGGGVGRGREGISKGK